MPRRVTKWIRILCTLVATGLALCILAPGVASAPPLQRPPVTPGPRPPAATPAPRTSDYDGQDDDPAGAHIELHITAIPPDALAGARELWTLVQWQDDAGRWQDVDGWRGRLEVNQSTRWWVAHRDFGTGPFRWVLYARQSGWLLAASPPFYLPKTTGETVTVVVTLPDEQITFRQPGSPPPLPPTARPSGSAWLPTTGGATTPAWLSITLVLALIIGRGLRELI